MVYLLVLVGFILTIGSTALIIPPLRLVASRRGWIDKPDGERKLHASPTPTVGGIAIFAGFVVGLVYLTAIQGFVPFEFDLPPLLLGVGVVIMVCTGLYDDIHGLGFKQKFLVQAFVAYLLLHAGYRIDVNVLPFVELDPYQQALYSIPLTWLWIVGVINAVNLIDGLDGLAGGVVIIGLASLALIFGFHGDFGSCMLALLLIGALIGFLIHNFNPASIFMGDAGSLFLGTMLAAYSLQGQMHAESFLSVLVPVLALGVPMLDTTLSIIRRAAGRKAIFAPDKDHIHHRLVARFSTRRAVLVLYGVSAGFGSIAVSIVFLPPGFAFGAIGIALVLTFVGLRSLGYLSGWTVSLGQSVPAFSDFEPARASESRITEPSTYLVENGEHSADSMHRPIPSSGDGASELLFAFGINTFNPMVKEHSIVVAADDLAFAELEGEAVVLSSTSGQYYGLNEIGTYILKLIEQPRPVNDIFSAILQEYEVEPETMKPHVLAFLQDMEDRQLIRVGDAVEAFAA